MNEGIWRIGYLTIGIWGGSLVFKELFELLAWTIFAVLLILVLKIFVSQEERVKE